MKYDKLLACSFILEMSCNNPDSPVLLAYTIHIYTLEGFHCHSSQLLKLEACTILGQNHIINETIDLCIYNGLVNIE